MPFRVHRCWNAGSVISDSQLDLPAFSTSCGICQITDTCTIVCGPQLHPQIGGSLGQGTAGGELFGKVAAAWNPVFEVLFYPVHACECGAHAMQALASKRLHRLFHEHLLPDSIGATVELDPEESKHAARVLRLTVDTEVEVCNGRGQLVTGRITGTDKSVVSVTTTAAVQTVRLHVDHERCAPAPPVPCSIAHVLLVDSCCFIKHLTPSPYTVPVSLHHQPQG